MWSHYGESHSGICIGFNAEHSFFTRDGRISNQFIPLTKVEYSSTRVLVSEISGSIESMVKNLTTKSTDWEYEQEERIVLSLGHSAKTIQADGIPSIHLFNVPHNLVSEICVGVRADARTITAAKEFANRMAIPAYQCKISSSDFNLDRQEL